MQKFLAPCLRPQVRDEGFAMRKGAIPTFDGTDDRSPFCCPAGTPRRGHPVSDMLCRGIALHRKTGRSVPGVRPVRSECFTPVASTSPFPRSSPRSPFEVSVVHGAYLARPRSSLVPPCRLRRSRRRFFRARWHPTLIRSAAARWHLFSVPRSSFRALVFRAALVVDSAGSGVRRSRHHFARPCSLPSAPRSSFTALAFVPRSSYTALVFRVALVVYGADYRYCARRSVSSYRARRTRRWFFRIAFVVYGADYPVLRSSFSFFVPRLSYTALVPPCRVPRTALVVHGAGFLYPTRPHGAGSGLSFTAPISHSAPRFRTTLVVSARVSVSLAHGTTSHDRVRCSPRQRYTKIVHG
ncbi:hypothetical protein C8R43DRAFT_1210919 [Mycena crocata]|nr:hypothetical protein C8R43DRAFT_1210919 [Mycena crocata]